MFHSPVASLSRAALIACATFIALAGVARGELILNEQFLNDPVLNGRATVTGSAARFTYDTDHLNAHYDSTQSTAILNWSLGQSLNQGTDFRFEADVTIPSAGFSASASNFAQLTFGLINSTTTGTNRTGSGGGFNAFDIATIDYFPADNELLGLPALGPTIVLRDDSTGVLGNVIRFPFDLEASLHDSLIAGDVEAIPPLDTPLTMIMTYDAASRISKVQMLGPGGLLPINLKGFLDDYNNDAFVGGLDDDITTIQLSLAPGEEFTVDTFALALWEAGSPATTADLSFSSLRVYNTVNTPEPGSIALLLIGMAGLYLWRRRR